MRRDVVTFLNAMAAFACLSILLLLCWWVNLPEPLLLVIAAALGFSLLLACVAGLVMHRNASVDAEIEAERRRWVNRFPDPQ